MAERRIRVRQGDVVIVGPLPDPNSGLRVADEQFQYRRAIERLGETHLPLAALVDMSKKPPTIELVTPAEAAVAASQQASTTIHSQVNLR